MARDGLPQCDAGALARASGGGTVRCRGSGEAACGNTFRPTSGTCIKEIHLADGRQFNERVRLFHAVELEAMLASAGIVIEQRFGDYQGARCSDGAPRALLLGRAA